MTTTTTFPPHGRLMTKLTALGPYLRQQQSSEGHFFFDCLASCISAKKEPEEREFWGWWLILTVTNTGFEYRYHFGRFDSNGDWLKDSVPAKHEKAVIQTLDDFYPKLTSLLQDEFKLTVTAASDLEEAELGTVA